MNNDYKAQGCSPHLLSVSISGQNTLIRYKWNYLVDQVRFWTPLPEAWVAGQIGSWFWISASREPCSCLTVTSLPLSELWGPGSGQTHARLVKGSRNRFHRHGQGIDFYVKKRSGWQHSSFFRFSSVISAAPCDLHKFFLKKISSSIVFPLASQL